MDRQAMCDSLTNLIDKVRESEEDLRRNIDKLNTYYSSIRLGIAGFPNVGLTDKQSHMRLLTEAYRSFQDDWEKVLRDLPKLLVDAEIMNETLLKIAKPKNNSDVQIIVIATTGTIGPNASDDIEYIGEIKGDDRDLKFTVVTDHSKMNTEEGMVKAIRIFDSDSRDLLNYRKPGTFKVIPDNNTELVEYFIKLLRKFDTKIQQEE